MRKSDEVEMRVSTPEFRSLPPKLPGRDTACKRPIISFRSIASASADVMLEALFAGVPCRLSSGSPSSCSPTGPRPDSPEFVS